ncbi:hypothetical protein [Pseudomonas sp. F(2018)]|uniref:hypothetical protein n=1 Tax=Pseudomonas sp. F(2018) TaxID=2502240 RepID=UPI0010F5AC5F|nr:hypothetical protein [Pseudomonas sp. F(2018)]
MTCATNWLQVAAAVAALVSAVLWLVSALVKTKQDDRPDNSGLSGGLVLGDGNGNDILATLKSQARWNTAAAGTASLAAALQALSMLC